MHAAAARIMASCTFETYKSCSKQQICFSQLFSHAAHGDYSLALAKAFMTVAHERRKEIFDKPAPCCLVLNCDCHSGPKRHSAPIDLHDFAIDTLAGSV